MDEPIAPLREDSATLRASRLSSGASGCSVSWKSRIEPLASRRTSPSANTVFTNRPDSAATQAWPPARRIRPASGEVELDAEWGQEQPVGVQCSADAGAGGFQDQAAAALHVDRVGRRGESAETAGHLDAGLAAGLDAVDAQVLLGADQDVAGCPHAQRTLGRDGQVHRLWLPQRHDARVVRVVHLGVAALGRSQRGALGLAQRVHAGRGVDDQVGPVGADVAVGDQRSPCGRRRWAPGWW